MKMKSLLLLFVALTFTLSVFSQSLADQVVGEFKGKLRNKTVDLDDYKINITKVSDTKVKIQPLTGVQSQTFTVDLIEETMGTIKVIKFKFATDHILNNGMYVDQNKKLSYAVHLGGAEMNNIEVFVGEKQ